MVFNLIYIYIVFFLVLLYSYNFLQFFQKFFFFSEILWLLVFLILLNWDQLISTIFLYNSVFLILMFTAIEMVMFSCILLFQNFVKFLN